MKMYVVLSAIIFLVLLLFPFVTLVNADRQNSNIGSSSEITSDIAESPTEATDMIQVLRTSSGKVENVDMTEYIIGSVACEMPASFHEEALKAQAVASYTYAKRIKQNAGNTANEHSDISDSSLSHQGYLGSEELKEKWGEKYDTYYNKLKSIVAEVEGQYLTYDDEPILAVFHAISTGTTNSAKDVWGKELSYLSSVSAPGDKLSSDLDSEAVYSEEEFRKIAESIDSVNLSKANDGNLLSDIKSAESGYVTEVVLGDLKLSGTDIRNYFSLKSPNFKVEYKDGNYIFYVKGKGHGVGMSQYSADFMARQGSDYKEILSHFYQGAVIETE